MIALAFAWIKARRMPLLIGAVILALFVVQQVHIRMLQGENAELVQQAKDAKAAAELSEQLRGQEQAQDQNSYADQSARCEQRVITALDAARAIEEVTDGSMGRNTAGVDGGRDIVGAGQLRRIIGQAGRGTAGVPAGSDRTAQR